MNLSYSRLAITHIMASSWLRVAVVQFAPKIGEVHANIAKAHELCRGLTPRSVDLVCFPEMIFTGYMFPDAPSIAPHLEHPQTGPTASFCSELARRLQCVVVAGFPERLEFPLSEPSASSPSALAPVSDSPTHPLIGANAANLYGPTGHLLHTYHKSNLFPTDRTWARPGHGFTALDLPTPLGRTAVAICNDVNVTAGEAWTSLESGPYELAGWCLRERVRVLVVLNAWLRPEDGGMEGVEEDERGDGNADADAGPGGLEGKRVQRTGEEDGEDGKEPNWDVLNYWAMRLRPLWAAKDVDHEMGTRSSSSGTWADTAPSDSDEQQHVVVIVCNRCGRERGKTFVGSSSMFAMRPGSIKPGLLHVMGEREEGVGVWTVRIGSQLLLFFRIRDVFSIPQIVARRIIKAMTANSQDGVLNMARTRLQAPVHSPLANDRDSDRQSAYRPPTLRISLGTLKGGKKKSNRGKACQANPNDGRCLITCLVEPIDVAHIVAPATETRLLTKLEYVWEKGYCKLNVNTRYNLLHLRSDWHDLYDRFRWMLIPQAEILRKMYVIYVVQKHKTHDLDKLFKDMSSTYKYYVLPSPTLTNPICRFPDVDNMEYHQHFSPPYVGLGAIESHVHPHYVIFNTGQNLRHHTPAPFDLLELLTQITSIKDAAESLRTIQKLYTLWTEVDVPAGFSNLPSPSKQGHPLEQDHPPEQEPPLPSTSFTPRTPQKTPACREPLTLSCIFFYR
ncbi:carbon-nitrogen hydrolase [Boletus reticuloceps]|uniref:Carbon-nitrogen hydrolase n=1 Tax=Boletus reticuloceps TaxID=495285 RepID=A0A8I3A4X6_9AGAM|nr:carbon-nitrogen hydrolase [Boletus reticuloceps]